MPLVHAAPHKQAARWQRLKACHPSSARLSLQHIDSGLAEEDRTGGLPSQRRRNVLLALQRCMRPRTRATRATWYAAAAGEISRVQVRPLPDAVTRSTGHGLRCCPDRPRATLLMRCLTASASAGLVGPRLEPVDDALLSANGDVADGRLQKYFGSENGWPISSDPSCFLSPCSIRLPFAACAKRQLGEAGHQRAWIGDAGHERQRQQQARDRVAQDGCHGSISMVPASARRQKWKITSISAVVWLLFLPTSYAGTSRECS